MPDHFGDQLAPVPALMAAADATSTLRLGTLVFDNDYRHPVVLAKEAATLDLLSGGRLELGLGAGWMRSDYEESGIAYDAPGSGWTASPRASPSSPDCSSPTGPSRSRASTTPSPSTPCCRGPCSAPVPRSSSVGGGRRVLDPGGASGLTS